MYVIVSQRKEAPVQFGQEYFLILILYLVLTNAYSRLPHASISVGPVESHPLHHISVARWKNGI